MINASRRFAVIAVLLLIGTASAHPQGMVVESITVESDAGDVLRIPVSHDVVLVPAGTNDRVPLQEATALSFLDSLEGRFGDSAVVVRCTCSDGKWTSLTFSGELRLSAVDTAGTARCSALLENGNVLAEGECAASVEGPEGAIEMTGTHYELRVSRGRSGPIQELAVYDGEVRVRRRSSSSRRSSVERLAATQAPKYAVVRSGALASREFPTRFIKDSAAIHARVAAGQAIADGAAEIDIGDLRVAYERVMLEPGNSDHRVALGSKLVTLKARPDSAIYHLARADSLTPARPTNATKKTTIARLTGDAYAARGESVLAAEYYKKATAPTKPDIGVKKTPVSPRVNPVRPVKPRQLLIDVKPETLTKPSRAVRLNVMVTSAGNPVSGVAVTLTAGGGSFAASKAAKLAGQTDASGRFQATWTCQRCAPNYQLSVEARKNGFLSAKRSVDFNASR